MASEKVEKIRDIYYWIGYPIEGRTDMGPTELEDMRVAHPRRFARSVSKVIGAFTGPLRRSGYDPADFYVVRLDEPYIAVQIWPLPSKLEPWIRPSSNGQKYVPKKQGYFVHVSISEAGWLSPESRKIKKILGGLGELLTTNCAEEVRPEEIPREKDKPEPPAEEIRKFFGLSSSSTV